MPKGNAMPKTPPHRNEHGLTDEELEPAYHVKVVVPVRHMGSFLKNLPRGVRFQGAMLDPKWT